MKKTKLKRRSSSALPVIKKSTWEACSEWVRLSGAFISTGGFDYAECFTCRKLYKTFGFGGIQAGHFIPGRLGLNLYDERGIRPQCSRCNNHLKGNWPAYYEHMVEECGIDLVNELLAQSKIIYQYRAPELLELRAAFKAKTKRLLETENID